MPRLLIIAQESQTKTGLCERLAQDGFTCSITSFTKEAMRSPAAQSADLVMIEIDSKLPDSGTLELIQRLKPEKHTPVMALVPGEKLDCLNGCLDVADDFIASPYDTRELVLRINRLLHKNGNTDSDELIKCDGLMIDLARCEVTVEGRVVELTFKEYELLKLLISNKGRVYTRESLLNRVWGYDYYGGDRTVDVHVRRLRSKIEDSTHAFIETVRNIGYRFRKDA
jgi:DNA-binding response OmpR family regulator